jgi:hypothetical protein
VVDGRQCAVGDGQLISRTLVVVVAVQVAVSFH